MNYVTSLRLEVLQIASFESKCIFILLLYIITKALTHLFVPLQKKHAVGSYISHLPYQYLKLVWYLPIFPISFDYIFFQSKACSICCPSIRQPTFLNEMNQYELGSFSNPFFSLRSSRMTLSVVANPGTSLSNSCEDLHLPWYYVESIRILMSPSFIKKFGAHFSYKE